MQKMPVTSDRKVLNMHLNWRVETDHCAPSHTFSDTIPSAQEYFHDVPGPKEIPTSSI